jgi:phosphoserine aminotransferase
MHLTKSLSSKGFAVCSSRAFSTAPATFTPAYKPQRVVNLSAGCAALPPEVLERAAKEMNSPLGKDISITEMGYRTGDFHEIMDRSEENFRSLMNIPDTHDVHFFNGGATLQFAAVPMNLLGAKGGKGTYIMNGHWSEKAHKEGMKFQSDSHKIDQVCVDETGLYFDFPEGKHWNISDDSIYAHYTSADTRQGFEFQDFDYSAIPENVNLVCDASANLGSKEVDISKYGVIYAAAHKNFSTSGVCYTVIRKDLIPKSTEDVHPHAPTMCNWHVFDTAPNKIWNVPVIFSIWLGNLVCEHMIERGGLPYYEDLAIRRSNTLYNYIDDSDGFYRCFVNDDKFRSRMQVVFTIRTGEGKDATLVEKFIKECEVMGWLDVRSHPLGISSDAIRITMYNPQPIEVVEHIREFMHHFKKENM